VSIGPPALCPLPSPSSLALSLRRTFSPTHTSIASLPFIKADPYICLVRASDGKAKISTTVRKKRRRGGGVQRTTAVPSHSHPLSPSLFSLLQVSAKDHARFIESYGTILKAHMDGLKKKEKAKKKK